MFCSERGRETLKIEHKSKGGENREGKRQAGRRGEGRVAESASEKEWKLTVE